MACGGIVSASAGMHGQENFLGHAGGTHSFLLKLVLSSNEGIDWPATPTAHTSAESGSGGGQETQYACVQ